MSNSAGRWYVYVFAFFVALLAPMATALPQCEPQWLTGSSYSGVSNYASASAVWDSDGEGPNPPQLILGGNFWAAGTVPAANVVAWDGSKFSPLGAGMNGDVNALATYGGQLIAAGAFTTADGAPASHIASWDGTAWHPLGAGLSGTVFALTIYNGELVAAGVFLHSGTTDLTNVARWDGTQWRPFGAGTNNFVRALAVLGGDLYAGGDFTLAGGYAAQYIAKWNGTAWSPLSAGMDGSVRVLGVFNNQVVAGGSFSQAGGTAVPGVAVWNGSAWAPPAGVPAGLTGSGGSFLVRNGELLVGGQFFLPGDSTSRPIARWDGAAWSWLPVGSLQSAWSLALFAGDLYATGFTPGGVARLDGSTWRALAQGAGFNYPVYAFTEFQGDLIASGSFTLADGVAASRIARWNGLQWQPMGAGFDGTVYALAVFNSSLYAAGNFTHSGSIPVASIARWNGTSWQSLGAGAGGTIYALAEYNGKLIAGGNFGINGVANTDRVAAWTGSVWQSVGGGNPFTGEVRALRAFGGGLIAVGVPQQGSDGLRYFNGVSWQPMFGGLTGLSYATEIYQDQLVLGGQFPQGPSYKTAMAWNGSAWNSLSFAMSAAANALAVQGDELFAGGAFITAGVIDAKRVARWNGQTWLPLTSGIGLNYFASVSAAFAYKGEVFFGGEFSSAGGSPALYWARWSTRPVPWVAQDPAPAAAQTGGVVTLAATPASGYRTVSYQWRRNGVAVLEGLGGAAPGGGTVTGASGVLASPTDGRPAVLSISGARPADAGLYTVVFSSACGSSESRIARVDVQPGPCGAADIGAAGGLPQPDAALDNNDFIVFINWFFAEDSRADRGVAGGLAGTDGRLDNNDFIVFINQFFAGC